MWAKGELDFREDPPQVSVSQYTLAIKKALEGQIAPCWILGEISNLRRQSSGHVYFSLKDIGAQLPAVMFRAQASRLSFEPRDGMQVLAFGEISVYEPYGRYQLIVRELKESGEGRLHREFERLKRKLSEEGLFAPERKRQIPSLPLRVAIVTSPTGAALQDFLRILQRRDWGGRLSVFPSKVQGVGAAAEVVASLEYINQLGAYDLIVVARGGGSLEDLWCFNEEAVARSVSKSVIPVISAVGHEIDFTLCDFASDLRVETPSAAAEVISSSYLDLLVRFQEASVRLHRLVAQLGEEKRNELSQLRRQLNAVSPRGALEKAFMRIDELGTRLNSCFQGAVHARRVELLDWRHRFHRIGVERAVADSKERARSLQRCLEQAVSLQLEQKRKRLDLAQATLRAISPQATLGRGFAIVQRASGGPLTDAGSAQIGEALQVKMRDGLLGVEVTKKSLDGQTKS